MKQSPSEARIPATTDIPSTPITTAINGDLMTTEKCLVVLLMTFDIPWKDKFKTEKGRTMFAFEREKASDLARRWQTGEPIMVDARKLFQAEIAFNSAVHDDF